MHECAILICCVRQRVGEIGVPGALNLEWAMGSLMAEIIDR